MNTCVNQFLPRGEFLGPPPLSLSKGPFLLTPGSWNTLGLLPRMLSLPPLQVGRTRSSTGLAHRPDPGLVDPVWTAERGPQVKISAGETHMRHGDQAGEIWYVGLDGEEGWAWPGEQPEPTFSIVVQITPVVWLRDPVVTWISTEQTTIRVDTSSAAVLHLFCGAGSL